MKLTRLLSVAVIAMFAAPIAVNAQSIAINFGADQPGGGTAGTPTPVTSSVDGSAGLFGTSVWNNFEGPNSDEPFALLSDDGSDSGVVVEWASNGVWASTGRGEENNTAPVGNDRNLMTGYLDTAGAGGMGVDISVSGLSYPSFDVYVYTTGGVIGRGGEYTIGDITQTNTTTNPFDGTYVEGAEGNYLVFPGLTGDSFNLLTVPTIGSPERAPVNGIEIRGVPEPSTSLPFVFGLLGLL